MVRQPKSDTAIDDPPRGLHDTTDAPDDATLLRSADRAAAFTVLYERYAPRVIAYCRSRISDSADAEDVAAQALAKAWHGFPPDHRGSFRSWLFTIAHHTIVDAYRQAARTPPIAGERTLQTVVAPEPDPESASMHAETRAELFAAIQTLPPDQQHAIALRIAGFRGSEVAEIMGRSPQAVKMLQFRAVSTLRARLGSDLAPGEETSR